MVNLKALFLKSSQIPPSRKTFNGRVLMLAEISPTKAPLLKAQLKLEKKGHKTKVIKFSSRVFALYATFSKFK